MYSSIFTDLFALLGILLIVGIIVLVVGAIAIAIYAFVVSFKNWKKLTDDTKEDK